ncbi:hypothetical protein AB8302_001748 [Vibrio parahaemolyticus]|nr:hypothetical protein [Vibrio parahaemolyticus]
MALTAFSKKLNCEVDAVQYFSLLGHNLKIDPELNSVTDEERYIVKNDVICPSCGVANAIIVSGSRNDRNYAIRQPHFRFVDEHGNDSHHEYCDLKTVKPFKDITSSYESFFNQKSKSHITKLIGNIISSALTNESIGVKDMIDFRQWHFNIKKEHIVNIESISEKLFPYKVYKCRKDLDIDAALSPKIDSTSVKNKLILDQIVAEDEKTLNKISQQPDFKIKDREVLSFFKKGERKVFDVRELSHEYMLSNMLGNTILDTFRLSLNSQRDISCIQACCSLFLFVNQWNIDKAIDMFNDALKTKDKAHTTNGNIIGLNPFYKYEFYSAVLYINDVAKYLPTNDELHRLIEFRGGEFKR